MLLKIVLIYSFTDIKADITFPDALQLLAFLNKGLKIDEQERIKKLFHEADMNEDGHLSLHQFFNFVDYSQSYWESIFKLKTNVINIFFPHGSYIDILERKLNIEDIKDYQTNHNGKFPKAKCVSSFKSCLFGVPNPYEYDYESSAGTIGFDSLVNIQIKTYKPFFEPQKKKDTFQIKHLQQFTKYKVVNKIDKYFIEFRNKSPQKMKSIQERRKNTISSSNNNMLEMAVSSARKPSILRTTTLRSRRNTLDYNLSGSNTHVLMSSGAVKRKSVQELVVTPNLIPQQPVLLETPIALHLGSSSVMVTPSVTEEPE